MLRGLSKEHSRSCSARSQRKLAQRKPLPTFRSANRAPNASARRKACVTRSSPLRRAPT